jgi:hypothetical protein
VRTGPIVWISLIVAVGIMLFGIWSVLRIDGATWAAAERRRSNWILMMLLFGPLAVLLFYGSVRQYLLYPERFEVVDGVSPVDR